MGHGLISANRVEGTAVFGTDDQRLGHIEEVMLDKVSGRVAYALMSFGGVMGLGERYHPVPWSMLSYDTTKNGYVIPVDKTQLEGALSLEGKEAGENDAEWRETLHAYYKATPYWASSGLM